MKNYLSVPFVLLAWAVAALIPARLPAAIPSTLITDNQGISGFELYGNGIHWWAGQGRCGSEFPSDATVRLRGTLGSPTRSLALSCLLHQGEIYSAARDEAYSYFFRQGVLHRKAVSAAETDPSQIMPSPGGAAQVTLPSGQLSAYVTVADGYVYWTGFTSSSGVAVVRRMRTDGSANPSSLLTISGGADVRKLQPFTYQSSGSEVQSLAVLTTDGRLYRINSGSLFSVLMSSGVADFAIHRRVNFGSSVTYIYAARGISTGLSSSTPPGSLIRMDAANPATATTIYTASGRNQVLGVTTDSTSSSLVAVGAPPKNVYIYEAVVNCGSLFCSFIDGNVKRHALLGSTTGWDLLVGSGAGGNLRSDDNYLYLLQYTNGRPIRIQRIASDAPALQLNVAADTMEVVQNSQDLNQSFTLIANKPTFVRAYAHLTTNTTGKVKWFPSGTLRGQRNGVDLPGSPLSHVNNTSIDTKSNLDTLRGSLNSSFLFELPASWTAGGSLTLTFTVNPTGTLPETGPTPTADNAVVRTVSFTKKDRPCLVLVPMHTTAPLYNPQASNSGLPEILARARSLLPVEDFRIRTLSEPISKLVVYVEVEYVPCFPLVCAIPVIKFRYEPFNMQDDEDWALFWLTFAHFLSSNPAGSPDTHWLGTVHGSLQGFNGIGGRSDLSLHDFSADLPDIAIPDFGTSDFLVVRMATTGGQNPWDNPLGGRTLAHELGHNYGRKHINQTSSGLGCGTSAPEGPFDNYPFDPCTIGPVSGNSAVFGFDPISRRVLSPTSAGDLMTYADTRWISKFTSDAIRQKVISVSPVSLESPAGDSSGGTSQLLVNGFINLRENAASFHPSYLLPPGAGNTRKIGESFEAMAKIGTQQPYRLRQTDIAGRILGEWPLLLTPVTDGRADRVGFIQFVPWSAEAGRLQVWRDGKMLAEKVASAHAPTLELARPVIDEAAQSIALSWTSTDLDQEMVIFTVQYSPDDGANWTTLRLNHPFREVSLSSAMLPGSTQARLRVIATDGLRTTLATSARFALANHAPVPVISGVTDGQMIPYGSPLRLQGLVLDAEEDSLTEDRLEWSVSGPVMTSAQGGSLSLEELPPGRYDITLAGTDRNGITGQEHRQIEVMAMAIPEGTGLVLDGNSSENAYTNAAFARLSLGNGVFVSARLVHADGHLYASFTDVPYGGSQGDTKIGLRIDSNASGDSTPQAGDIGFYVDEDGIGSQMVGSGVTMVQTLSPQLGFSSAIVRGASRWSAELRIDDGLIGGWNHSARLVLHCDRPAAQVDSRWPYGANLESPQTWALAYFASLPVSSNHPPIAIAGRDQSIAVPMAMPVSLDGSASHDADGNPLIYLWAQVEGPSVALAPADSATPTFTANPVTTPTQLRFRLLVNDGTLNSASDDVLVTLLPAPAPTFVNATAKAGNFLADGSFAGGLMTEPEQRYQIQATTNLVDWESIGSAFSDFYGVLPILDAEARQFPHRFYRATKR